MKLRRGPRDKLSSPTCSTLPKRTVCPKAPLIFAQIDPNRPCRLASLPLIVWPQIVPRTCTQNETAPGEPFSPPRQVLHLTSKLESSLLNSTLSFPTKSSKSPSVVAQALEACTPFKCPSSITRRWTQLPNEGLRLSLRKCTMTLLVANGLDRSNASTVPLSWTPLCSTCLFIDRRQPLCLTFVGRR